MSDTIGPLPGRENVAVVIECGHCRGQAFRVSWVAVPVARLGNQPGTRFLLLAAKGAPGERLSPRYCLECLGCGWFALASPDGPDPQLVRGDTRNN